MAELVCGSCDTIVAVPYTLVTSDAHIHMNIVQINNEARPRVEERVPADFFLARFRKMLDMLLSPAFTSKSKAERQTGRQTEGMRDRQTGRQKAMPL